jgi:hypothetical protein
MYMRGGTYNQTGSINLTKTGTSIAPMNLFAFPGEMPILEFATQSVPTRGVGLSTDYWHIKGITIQNANSLGMTVSGSNNTIDQVTFRYNHNSGIELFTGGGRTPSNNLIVNCDSYLNYDPQAHGENADGFSAKSRGLGPGNVFRGVRSWGNSDDGIDFWEAENGVTVENSYFYKNGFNIWGDTAFAGDGNGIKLGRDSGTHLVKNSLAWGNAVRGVDINGNALTLNPDFGPITHGVTIYNVTSYNNGDRNFSFYEDFPHVLRNNVSFAGAKPDNINATNDDAFNTWNGYSTDAADFLSLDDSIATGARLMDGSIPFNNFLRLAPGSNLIDAGTYVGIGYTGAAPDLGAFEVPEPASGLIAMALVTLTAMRRRIRRNSRCCGAWRESQETAVGEFAGAATGMVPHSGQRSGVARRS